MCRGLGPGILHDVGRRSESGSKGRNRRFNADCGVDLCGPEDAAGNAERLCGKDVGLIVEVAYSSLAEDRAMVAVYGRSGIPIYWILNLVDHQVEVYSCPQPDGYATRTDYQSGQHVPVVLDGTVLARSPSTTFCPDDSTVTRGSQSRKPFCPAQILAGCWRRC